MKTILMGIGLSPIAFILALAFLFSGCAQFDNAKEISQIIVNKTIDRTYDLTCNMRFKTEASFLARKQISPETMAAWCKR